MFKGALSPLLAVAAVAIIVSAGLCLLDTDEAAGGDLCILFLGTSLALFMAVSLTPTGHLLPALAKAYNRYPPDLPAPPPKA